MSKTKTIAIYESDWKELEKMLGERRTFREVVHDLILNKIKQQRGISNNGKSMEKTESGES